MTKSAAVARLMLMTSMVIYGTIGLFRTWIPLPSSVLAVARGAVGAVFLLLLTLARGGRPSRRDIRRNLPLLLCSGAAMGLNWVLLFEAYRYTTVATATLCYYMAPTFLMLGAALVLRERLNARRLVCVLAALAGMVLVSGVTEAGFSAGTEGRGVALGLGAALLYAGVILMNKRLGPMSAYDKTVVQLLAAAAAVLPYGLRAGDFAGLTLSPRTAVMLAVVCVLHTGVAYALYFGSMDALPAHTLALWSYIDPVVAVLLSAALLHERLELSTVLGAVLVLGAALVGEWSGAQTRPDAAAPQR